MKSQPAAALLVAIVLLAPSAFAGSAASTDTAVIDACLKTAEKAGGFGGTCVGLVADSCIKTAKGTNDDVAKWKACSERELVVWSRKTDEALKVVQTGGFADIVKAAQESQKTFAASRERLCAVFDKVEPGMYLGGADYCRMRETANRALSLIKLGAAVNEH